MKSVSGGHWGGADCMCDKSEGLWSKSSLECSLITTFFLNNYHNLANLINALSQNK